MSETTERLETADSEPGDAVPTGPEEEFSRLEADSDEGHGRLIRVVLLILFIQAYLGLSVVFRLVLKTNIVYTHFAYIPIILAGIWWGRKALIVAAVLSVELLAYRFSGISSGEPFAELGRMAFFFVIAAVVGELSRRTMLASKRLERREQFLSEMNVKCRHLSRIRRDFLHIAVHDIQSPISAADMLVHSFEAIHTTPTPKEKHILDRIHGRLAEATSFLREFQFFAALDSSSVARHACRVSLADVLRSVVDQNQDLASDKRHDLVLSLPDDLPEVWGIERLLHEVAANLVTNAIKYTNEGGTILVRAWKKDAGRVRFEVKDNGVGISQEDQADLFKEFTRLRRRDDRAGRIPGIGLGLSIVKRITELHGGAVDLHSEPGKGSIFGVELPTASAARELRRDSVEGETPALILPEGSETAPNARE